MSRDLRDLADYVRTSRAAQGLPERIEDPAALDRIAALLTATAERGGQRDAA
jgi:hypothetical protein